VQGRQAESITFIGSGNFPNQRNIPSVQALTVCALQRHRARTRTMNLKYGPCQIGASYRNLMIGRHIVFRPHGEPPRVRHVAGSDDLFTQQSQPDHGLHHDADVGLDEILVRVVYPGL
jgi:hypothetical protein